MSPATVASSHPVFPADSEAPVPLPGVAVGGRRVVVRVEGPDQADLAREGIHPGGVVVVTARTPLGGPLIVELGRTRLAISTSVAAQVLTRTFTSSDDPSS